MSAIDDLPPLREVIRRYDLSAKKSLGQNFLLDFNLINRIARSAGPLADVDVVEIGPGPGGLTRALLAQGARRVIAIERDARAIAALEDIATRNPGRLEIIAGNALDIDLRKSLQGSRARVVANLPYNIASALLVGWLSIEPWPPWYDRLVLMFQREVADRIVAGPGGKSYGRLSVLVGWRSQARILFDVSPTAFVPSPKPCSAPDATCLRSRRARARHRGRLRAAPQNAASEPQAPWPRSLDIARCRGYRAHRTRGRDISAGLRRAHARFFQGHRARCIMSMPAGNPS